MAMGQDVELLSEVSGWINKAATKPVWAKMTPNITDISQPALASLVTGCEGVAAINTIQCVIGVNLVSRTTCSNFEFGLSTSHGVQWLGS